MRTGLLLFTIAFAWLVGSQAVRRAQLLSPSGAASAAAATASSIANSGALNGGSAGNAVGGNSGAIPVGWSWLVWGVVISVDSVGMHPVLGL